MATWKAIRTSSQNRDQKWLHSDQPPWHTFLLNLKETLMETYGKNLVATKASFHSHHKQFERQREA